MPRTSWAQMGAHYCPVPPLSEQQAIAGHLDAETAKIDQAMSVLRREPRNARAIQTVGDS